jgi:CheY-like chemotaxis protein
MDGGCVDTESDPGFLQQVRDALSCLYDHARLQRHPLAERLVSAQTAITRTRAQELRRILLDAIEALNPGDNVPIRAPERRPYAILFGLYVEGRTWHQVADSLGIGGRQLRRDRGAALEALASILRDRYLAQPGDGGSPVSGEPLRLESERLARERKPVDLRELVDELIPLLDGLVHDQEVRLVADLPPDLPKPSTSRILVRQILINLASQALKTLPLARLSFEASSSEAVVGIGLSLEYRERGAQAEKETLGAELGLELGPAETLATALGATLHREMAGDRSESIWVLLPVRDETVVLVVDDNQELFELFQRYAVGQPYRLTHAASADQALSVLKSANPDVITLDLMMPDRDGWELLQSLRSDPANAHIPVVVCSVLGEPELALSQGAQVYLNKPVEQTDLLQALARARTMAWEGEARRGLPAHNSASRSR